MLPVRGPHHHHPGTLGLLGSCGGGTGWGLTSHPQRDSPLPPGVAVGAQPSPHSCWDALPSSSPDHSCPGLIRDTPPISSSSAPFPEPSYLSVYILVLCNLNNEKPREYLAPCPEHKRCPEGISCGDGASGGTRNALRGACPNPVPLQDPEPRAP